MMLLPSSQDASVAAEFDRTSAGLEKYPYELDKIFLALDQCTIFMAIGTSGVVEPAASFVAHVRRRATTI